MRVHDNSKNANKLRMSRDVISQTTEYYLRRLAYSPNAVPIREQ